MPFLGKKCIFLQKYLRISKKSSTFASAFDKTAGWMSDLVSGLQNRLERFDSATGLQAARKRGGYFYGRDHQRHNFAGV